MFFCVCVCFFSPMSNNNKKYEQIIGSKGFSFDDDDDDNNIAMIMCRVSFFYLHFFLFSDHFQSKLSRINKFFFFTNQQNNDLQVEHAHKWPKFFIFFFFLIA